MNPSEADPLRALLAHTQPTPVELAREAAGTWRFSGASLELGWGRIFGGQLIAQGLAAAAGTLVDAASRPAHAVHASFLEPGDPALPVDYEVRALRDGLSFSTRLVTASQARPDRPPRPLLCMTASFQVPEDGLDHAEAPPEVPPPESLATERELLAPYLDRLPGRLADRYRAPMPIDIRPVAPNDPLAPEVRPPARALWFRAVGEMPDALPAHQRVFAWASDFYLLGTALQPHGVTWMTPDMQVASLDHSIWFHRPLRFDTWHLFAMESPSASGGRGLAEARVFDRGGRLVASLAQEGLMRRRIR
jgi:acyl-CoA thioesterase-2